MPKTEEKNYLRIIFLKKSLLGPIEFEAENISLTSLNAATAISGGPPSDISDRSANSDKLSIDKGPVGTKKEASGDF